MKTLLFIIMLENIFSSFKTRKNKYCRNYRLLREANYPDCIINFLDESKIKIKNNFKKIEKPLDLTDFKPKQENCDVKFCESKKDTNIHHAPSDITSKKVSFNDDQKYKSCLDNKPKNTKDSNSFFNNYFEIACADLDQYIRNNIKQTYMYSYIVRLDKIIKAHSFLLKNIHNLEKNCGIFDPYDHELIKMLEKMCLDFNGDKKFTQEICTSFLNKLFDSIFANNDILPLREKLDQMSITDKNILCHAEFFKCSIYFGEIPELMTLGMFDFDKADFASLISVHLINLMLRKRIYINEENRGFVLFLINKVFETSTQTLLDFFSVKKLFYYCTKDTKHLHKKNLHFFLWELNRRKQNEIKKKLKDNCTVVCSSSDSKHTRVVVLLFLFHRLIYFRFFNDINAEFEKYVDLMNCIIDERNY